MKFSQFLIEGRATRITLNEKHELVLQKILDAVDDGHVEYTDSLISFDIGVMIDAPQLKGLKLVIRKSPNDSIRLGKGKDDNYAIVIDTSDELPGRQDIDTFLAGKKLYSGFKKAYDTYVSNYHDRDKKYEPNSTEAKLNANSRDSFEGSYTALIKAAESQRRQYIQAVAEIDKELSGTANVGRKKALELAKHRLKDDYLGKTDKEFIGKILALPEAEFVKNLDKEWKAKLESRLSSYFKSSN